MTNHSRKINKAWGLASKAIHHGPVTVNAIMAPINGRPRLLDELTAQGLADLINALHDHWQAAQAEANHAALAEGAIWDNRAKKMREIAA